MFLIFYWQARIETINDAVGGLTTYFYSVADVNLMKLLFLVGVHSNLLRNVPIESVVGEVDGVGNGKSSYA